MLKLGKNADGLFTFGNPNELGKILKTSGTTSQAHHIIPWSLAESDLVQKAAEAGFHLNDELNGIVLQKYSKALAEGVHGNHPAYTKYIENQLNEFINSRKISEITATEAKDFLEKRIIPRLKNQIEKAVLSGMNLNEYFKTISNSGY